MIWYNTIKSWFIKVWSFLQEFFYTGDRCYVCTKHLDLLGDEIILGVRGTCVNFYLCEECSNDIAAGIDVSA